MFDRWIQSAKLRAFIQRFLFVIIDDLIEMLFYIYNIYKLTVLIKLIAFQLQLKHIMM